MEDFIQNLYNLDNKVAYSCLKELEKTSNYKIGFEIDHSFLTYKKEAKEFGYEVDKISIKEKRVIFNKI